MNQEISPRVVIAIVAAVAVIALIFIWRAYTGPSASTHGGGGVSAAGNGGARARVQAMKDAMMAAHSQQKPAGGQTAQPGGTH